VTDLYTKDLKAQKFTDVPLEGKDGYFIIAAPSTWPPFAAKIKDLIRILELINLKLKIIMIYTKEAHADDIWPVGYGINSTKTLEERVTNCDALCNKYLGLFELVDAIFIDNMDDDFTETTGAWPEGYIFTDCEGKALWKSNFDIKGVYSLEKVYNFAVE